MPGGIRKEAGTHEEFEEAGAKRHRSRRSDGCRQRGKRVVIPPDAYIMVAGKRLAVDITSLKQSGTGQGNAVKPCLRFDKVATRLIERLQATLGETVPDGMTVSLTITPPIRLPSKTAASLEDRIQTLLGRGSPGRDEKETVHGNRVRIRLLRDEYERAPKMIGVWLL